MLDTGGDIYTYLDNAADTALAQVPLKEADDLVFAVLSYLDLSGVILPAGQPALSVKDASEAYFRVHPIPQTVEDDGSNCAKALQMVLYRMAGGKRYRDLKLSEYTVVCEPEHLREFCAFCIHSEPGEVHVVFRGTSDSLAGWQESFRMACPGSSLSQEDAADYLREVGEEYPDADIFLCGHSKGGNHAVYAAVHAPETVRARIRGIRIFDGIGFSEEFLSSMEYQSLRGRIRYYVPSASVIGTLLPTYGKASNAVVVSSTAKGFLQHDLKTWQISDFRFERCPKRSAQSIRAVRRIRAWIAHVPAQERAPFTDALFQVVYATGVTTFPELSQVKINDWFSALGKLLTLKRTERRRIREFIILLRKTINQV